MLSTIISLSITTFPWIIPASLQIFNFKVEYICSLYWGEGGRGEKRKKERGREGRKFIKRKKREKKNLSLDSAVPSEQTMIFISLKISLLPYQCSLEHASETSQLLRPCGLVSFSSSETYQRSQFQLSNSLSFSKSPLSELTDNHSTLQELLPQGVSGVLSGFKEKNLDLSGSPSFTLDISDISVASWWLSGKVAIRKIPWRREWHPTPVFLPGKSHGQKSLAGYSPWKSKRVVQDLETKQQRKQSDISKDYPDNLVHFHELSFGL